MAYYPATQALTCDSSSALCCSIKFQDIKFRIDRIHGEEKELFWKVGLFFFGMILWICNVFVTDGFYKGNSCTGWLK